MTTIGVDVVQSALKLIGLPDRKCFTSLADLLKLIPELYAVEIPTGITNVSIGNAYPPASEQNNLWVRTDSVGSFVGFYIFATGQWRQIYPLPDQIFLIVGDSRSLPPGYTLASSDVRLTAQQVANLKKIWTIGGTTPATWYSVFHVTFVGF